MKKKLFKILTFISFFVWSFFAFASWYQGYDLGSVATLGGIALMFAWTFFKENLKN